MSDDTAVVSAVAVGVLAGLILLAVAGASTVAVHVADARSARRARPPRRYPVAGRSLELQRPGQPGDVQTRCLRCPWEASAPTAAVALMALDEHARREHPAGTSQGVCGSDT